jgi:hypothetical protein
MSKSHTAPTEIDHLTSLANGRFAYVHLEDGRSIHANTSSPEFEAAISQVVSEGHAKRVRVQLDRLAAVPTSCWPEVASKLEESGVFN